MLRGYPMILLSTLPKVTLQLNICILLIIKILLSQGVEATNQVNKRDSLNHKILLYQLNTCDNTRHIIRTTPILLSALTQSNHLNHILPLNGSYIIINDYINILPINQ